MFCVSELLMAVAPGRKLSWVGRFLGGFASGLVLQATYLEVRAGVGVSEGG
jgi:predicted MFS family arabinose efflux permease